MAIRTTFPFYRQLDSMDCGPTCLRMVAAHFGKSHSIYWLRNLCHIDKAGVSFSSLKGALEKMGFKALPVEIDLDTLKEKVQLPCILHWDKKHFVVLYQVSQNGIWVADPAIGKIRYEVSEFLNHWQSELGTNEGRAIIIEPTSIFYDTVSQKEPKIGLAHSWQLLKAHQRKLLFTVLTLLIGSSLTLILPFITQAIVDKGINGKSLSLIKLLALAQLLLVFGRIAMDVIRARLLFGIGTEISIETRTSFLSKLLKLPFTFFDTRNIGDNIQRMQDNQKVEQFFTESLVNILLAIISFLVFGSVLAYYNMPIFCTFLVGSAIMLCWILVNSQQRKIIDYKLFRQSSANQLMLVESISAIQEIKLTGCENQKTTHFEQQQRNAYAIKLKSLKLDQRIQNGTQLVNEIKNVLITYLAASAVVSGEMSMGMMLSISFIAGQLNTPIFQFTEFIRTYQNADFSMRRMNEIFLEADEDDAKQEFKKVKRQSLRLSKISFRYGAPETPLLFDDLSLKIPYGKTTAIVGMSGSGKTTLLKLLLKFYSPFSGNILLGETDLDSINASEWRKRCGVVMQDGFIFADTISNNVTVGFDAIDHERLIRACKMSNMLSFIESLPFGFNTIIGKDGHGLSEGQKQRILIARLIYKNPDFVFMDEATNSLDANNEKVIQENLDEFFVGRTVVVVAHRLSTVRNADNIVVLDKGRILEQGSHKDLALAKGPYYTLIKNQLELGK
ncbi:peptidase domain-containing ABC transporter [uncultured Pedobacter sp.]|uniref:peptidase domain-containing ABC transporter n=1 Tax=uncultured Pedobacter sp. TaxID=246139 RepID=UPI002600E4CC|nr:peptidase domain-containing ABC transporter [uncultured Pedobacter sp.]